MICSLSEFIALRDSLKNKTIITTNGCFDILHPGHLEGFARAKTYADFLVVLINSDESEYFKTKPGRPINSLDFRSQMLNGLRDVDYVIAFSESNPVDVLLQIHPDFHYKWGDYVLESLPEYQALTPIGGEVLIFPTLAGYSTTGVIQRVLEIYSKK
jgi:rfaE bifunctional protein nucleotidyltransferase chain/domain